MSASTERREPRNQFNQIQQPTSMETDQNPTNLSRLSKPTISSLLLSSFSSTPTPEPPAKKKVASFRGLGCTSTAAQVSVPAVIRSSAEWEDGKRVKKKRGMKQQKKKKKEGGGGGVGNDSDNGNDGIGNGGNLGSCMVIQDVWCGPGIGLSSDAVVGSVDCVVSRRNVVSSNSGRGKVDGVTERRERERDRDRERERERERPLLGRRAAVNPESLSYLDANPAFSSRPEPEVLGRRNYRHVRHPSPDEFAEIMLLQNTFIMGGRLDRFSNWRLDIDNMSYEQLLELGDRIGYVCTGLKEDEIDRCVRRVKMSILDERSSQSQIILDKKCSICQDEYEVADDLGKLDCGHGFHMQCLRQWLAHKNVCPVCKKAPIPRG